MHCWADLQSGHGLRCYGSITRAQNVSDYMLVLALCLVYLLTDRQTHDYGIYLASIASRDNKNVIGLGPQDPRIPMNGIYSCLIHMILIF